MRSFKEHISEAPEILGYAKTMVNGMRGINAIMGDDMEIVINACKTIKAAGITKKSSKENYDHFLKLYMAWHKLNYDRISYHDDAFKEVGRKFAAKAGVGDTYDMFIGKPGRKFSVDAFCEWAFNSVPNRVGKSMKKIEPYFPMWKNAK